MMNWIYNWYDPAGEIDPARLGDLMAAFSSAASSRLIRRRTNSMATMTEPQVKTLIQYRAEDGLAIIELDDPPAEYLHL